MTPELAPGVEVRITIEGTVTRIMPPGRGLPTRVMVERRDGKIGLFRVGGDSSNKIEVIEPEYVHMGIYRAANGAVYRYKATGVWGQGRVWEIFGASGYLSFEEPSRPLERIDS